MSLAIETTQPERIATLRRLGFSAEEAERYLALGDCDAQLRMLRARRRALLDNIHAQQKLLDTIDFLIWDKRKERVH